MEKTVHVRRSSQVKTALGKHEHMKKFEYTLIAKKSETYIRDLVYTDSIITAFVKVNQLIELLNKKSKLVWSLQMISLIED